MYFVSRRLLCFWHEARASSLLPKLSSSESVSLTGKGLAFAGPFINRDGRLAIRFRFPITVMVNSLFVFRCCVWFVRVYLYDCRARNTELQFVCSMSHVTGMPRWAYLPHKMGVNDFRMLWVLRFPGAAFSGSNLSQTSIMTLRS